MKARIKSGKPEKCLTIGKLYDVYNFDYINSIHCGFAFNIRDDNGRECYCLERQCSWLDNGSWELIND